MARLENTSLNDLPAFGRRLMELSREKGIGSPTLLATKLYDDYCDLVEPAKRKNKYGKIVKDRTHDISAITRMVQTHFNEENAYNVQSKYLFAYSKLFNCSLDYLYGTVSVKSTDPDVRTICRKLGLSEKVVHKLMRKPEIYLEGSLYAHFDYDFLYKDLDPEAKLLANSFWNELLESDMFIKLPEKWAYMACALQLHNAIKESLDSIDSKSVSMPDRNTFFEIVDEYYATHPDERFFDGNPFDIYDNDPEQALEILQQIHDFERYDRACDEGKSNMVYLGSSGQFDRFIQNYFHDKAEKYEIPRIKDYQNNNTHNHHPLLFN